MVARSDFSAASASGDLLAARPEVAINIAKPIALNRSIPFSAAMPSRQCEDLQRNSSGGPRVMDKSANLFRGFTRESRFTATLADLRRDVFHQDTSVINREHFAHELAFCDSAAADMILKHGYLRLF